MDGNADEINHILPISDTSSTKFSPSEIVRDVMYSVPSFTSD